MLSVCRDLGLLVGSRLIRHTSSKVVRCLGGLRSASGAYRERRVCRSRAAFEGPVVKAGIGAAWLDATQGLKHLFGVRSVVACGVECRADALTARSTTAVVAPRRCWEAT